MSIVSKFKWTWVQFPSAPNLFAFVAEWLKAFVKPVKYNDKESVEQLTDVQEQLLEYSCNI